MSMSVFTTTSNAMPKINENSHHTTLLQYSNILTIESPVHIKKHPSSNLGRLAVLILIYFFFVFFFFLHLLKKKTKRKKKNKTLKTKRENQQALKQHFDDKNTFPIQKFEMFQIVSDACVIYCLTRDAKCVTFWDLAFSDYKVKNIRFYFFFFFFFFLQLFLKNKIK